MLGSAGLTAYIYKILMMMMMMMIYFHLPPNFTYLPTLPRGASTNALERHEPLIVDMISII
jgi:hypothetical protein